MKIVGFLLVGLLQIYQPAAQQLNVIFKNMEIDSNTKYANFSVKMKPRELPGDNTVDLDMYLFKEIRNSLLVRFIHVFTKKNPSIIHLHQPLYVDVHIILNNCAPLHLLKSSFCLQIDASVAVSMVKNVWFTPYNRTKNYCFEITSNMDMVFIRRYEKIIRFGNFPEKCPIAPVSQNFFFSLTHLYLLLVILMLLYLMQLFYTLKNCPGYMSGYNFF